MKQTNVRVKTVIGVLCTYSAHLKIRLEWGERQLERMNKRPMERVTGTKGNAIRLEKKYYFIYIHIK